MQDNDSEEEYNDDLDNTSNDYFGTAMQSISQSLYREIDLRRFQKDLELGDRKEVLKEAESVVGKAFFRAYQLQRERENLMETALNAIVVMLMGFINPYRAIAFLGMAELMSNPDTPRMPVYTNPPPLQKPDLEYEVAERLYRLGSPVEGLQKMQRVIELSPIEFKRLKMEMYKDCINYIDKALGSSFTEPKKVASLAFKSAVKKSLDKIFAFYYN